MIDKTLEIINFFKQYYSPGNIDNTLEDLQLTTSGVLELLFQIFPKDCIDDYDLHSILTQLNYTPQKKGIKEFVWCLKQN
jgi:hypothetical protein